MRLGILLFTSILLLTGITLHAQEAATAPAPVPVPVPESAAAADSAANAGLKAQLKAELLSEIRARALFRSEDRRQQRAPTNLTADRGRVRAKPQSRRAIFFSANNYLRYDQFRQYKNDKSHGRRMATIGAAGRWAPRSGRARRHGSAFGNQIRGGRSIR